MKLSICSSKDKINTKNFSADPGASWTELLFGDEVIYLVPTSRINAFREAITEKGRALPTQIVDETFGVNNLYLVYQKGGDITEQYSQIYCYLSRDRYSLMELSDDLAAQIGAEDHHISFKRIDSDLVVFSIYRPDTALIRQLPKVLKVLNKVEVENFKKNVRRIVGSETPPIRHSASTGYLTVLNDLASLFNDLRLDVSTQDPVELSDGRKTANLIAKQKTKNGAATDELLIVCAHLDSVGVKTSPTVAQASPGADDNASGCAGVIEIANALSGLELTREVWYVLFGGEEQGLVGSKHFVSELIKSADDLKRFKVAINMDMIAWKESKYESALLIHGGHRSFAKEIADQAGLYNVGFDNITYMEYINDRTSDHASFHRAEPPLPSISIMEFGGRNDNWHSATDTFDTLLPDYAIKLIKMNLAYVASQVL